MTTSTCVALLRGINVGGRNPLPMAELRSALESEGFSRVETYIQSGNVVFESDRHANELEGQLEQIIKERFELSVPVVVRTRAHMTTVVDAAPDGFGTEPDTYHYDAMFLKSPLTTDAAMSVVKVRDGVDRAWAGDEVVYFSRLSARRTQSRLSSIMGTPEYSLMTIRNWRTTTHLLAMMNNHR